MFGIANMIASAAQPIVGTKNNQASQAPAPAPVPVPGDAPAAAQATAATPSAAQMPAQPVATNARELFKNGMQRQVVALQQPRPAAQPVRLQRYQQAGVRQQAGLPQMVAGATSGQPAPSGGGFFGIAGQVANQVANVIRPSQTDVRGFAPVDENQGFGRAFLGRFRRTAPVAEPTAPPPQDANYYDAWRGW